MSHPKTVQIDYELFQNICDYIFEFGDFNEPLCQEIKEGLQEKLDALARRAFYTQYKTGATKEIRAIAREHYLEEKGIFPSYRWPAEYDENITRVFQLGSPE